MLEGSVVVRAIGDGRAQTVGTSPGAHEHVGARLRGGVRRGRVVRSLLGKLGRVVEGEIAVDLVGRDVMVANAVFAHGLQQAEGALDIRAQEGLRISNRVIVVGFGGIVHDCVMARHELVQQLRVADVAHHKLHAI